MFSAWASKKSKKYFIANGALLLGRLQMLLKSFSSTEWIATWKTEWDTEIRGISFENLVGKPAPRGSDVPTRGKKIMKLPDEANMGWGGIRVQKVCVRI